jgi:hypothetical protein
MITEMTYATFRTAQAAYAALEEFFSMGDICEGEHPAIVARDGRFHIVLEVVL